ncbi:YcxB family protein [Paracoccus sp. S1E-3]|uniref:YcxB family protein n=2 Tax=Paracoccus TaxID=265 RepID=UPI0015EEBCD0|nr:YcxB family protein [Paracoccus sp. S1E-3]MBA4491282.1 YcxB family protein [Paracoccus sp. S1E-3]
MNSYPIRITPQDFGAAYALRWRRILRNPWIPLSSGGLVIMVNLLMGGSLIQVLTSPAKLVTSIGILAIVWGLMYLLIPPLSGWIAARWQYDRYPMLRREVEMLVEETGLKFLSAADQWSHRWSDYLKTTEDGGVMLLFVSPQLFQILPVGAVPATVRAEIAQRLRAANGKAG